MESILVLISISILSSIAHFTLYIFFVNSELVTHLAFPFVYQAYQYQLQNPPLIFMVWGLRPWPACGEESVSAIADGSMIWTLLDEVQLWLDFEGALGVVAIMASNLCVLGEDCEAMTVISSEKTVN